MGDANTSNTWSRFPISSHHEFDEILGWNVTVTFYQNQMSNVRVTSRIKLNHWRIQGKAKGEPISFIFIQFLAKNLPNNRLAHPLLELAHPLWEIQNRHCKFYSQLMVPSDEAPPRVLYA